MKDIKPFSPKDALAHKEHNLHPGIIQIVNELLGTRYSKGRSVTIKQEEVVDAFIERYPDIERRAIFDNNMLDFEAVYRKMGWKVTYDKPGYNEEYEPFWLFRVKE